MRKLLNHLAAFRRAQEGLAYLEFAICLPFLFLLTLGSIEMTRYILITQKVEKVSITLSDVVAQSNTMTTGQLDTIIFAAAEVMRPFTFGAKGYVIISSVTKDGTSNPPRVNWQYTGGGTWTQASLVGSVGNVANLPAGFTMNDKENVIIAEVFYDFETLILSDDNILTGGSIYKVSYFKPRLGSLSTLSSLPFWFVQKGAFI